MKNVIFYLLFLSFILSSCETLTIENDTNISTNSTLSRIPPEWKPVFGILDVWPNRDSANGNLFRLKNAGITKVELGAWMADEMGTQYVIKQIKILQNSGFNGPDILVPIPPTWIKEVTMYDPINITIIKNYIDSVVEFSIARFFYIDEPQWLNTSQNEYRGYLPPEVITRIGVYINSKVISYGGLYLSDPISNTGLPNTVPYNSDYYNTAYKLMPDRYQAILSEQRSDYIYIYQNKYIAPLIATMWVPGNPVPTIPTTSSYINSINNARGLADEVWFYSMDTNSPPYGYLFEPISRWNSLKDAISINEL